MRRWDRWLGRALRALIACTVLLFAVPSSPLSVEPLRDVSAWQASSRATLAGSRGAEAAPGAEQAPSASLPRRASAARAAALPAEGRAPGGAPLAARVAPDQRYLYLALQTLRC
jgi:hypothetical protein